jgi:uncharacterized protein YndB with AHSA1/START domain
VNYGDYIPGAACGAEIRKEGEKWTLVVVRELRHRPEKVWRALTEPVHLAEWAPFDADRSLGVEGPVTLSTVGTPAPQISASTVKRAEEPRLLEYDWGGGTLRWELEATERGTRLRLWHGIDKGFIAWGAAGWHICFDVLERALEGKPVGRIAGMEVMKFAGWQRLKAEYEVLFGVGGKGAGDGEP